MNYEDMPDESFQESFDLEELTKELEKKGITRKDIEKIVTEEGLENYTYSKTSHKAIYNVIAVGMMALFYFGAYKMGKNIFNLSPEINYGLGFLASLIPLIGRNADIEIQDKGLYKFLTNKYNIK